MTNSTEKKMLRKIIKNGTYCPKHHECDTFVTLQMNGLVNLLKFGYYSVTEAGKKEI